MTELEVAPACPECGGPMEARRARRGRNAGGLFWGCLDYPECRGTRDHGEGATSEDESTDGQLPTERLGPPPDCPHGHGPMVLKVARRGRNAGRPFWSCSAYPQCRETADAGEPAGSVHQNGAPARARSAVTWFDGTLDRPGWSCRYTTVGGSLRALPGSAELGAHVAQSWIARTEGSTALEEDVQRVIGLCRKILQRGSAPPIHPDAETALLAKLGLSGRLVPSRLPGDLSAKLTGAPSPDALTGVIGYGNASFAFDSSVAVDSDAEGALIETLAERVPAEAARWVVPQASLEGLVTTGEAVGRRVDFLAAPPWTSPFVIEVDGAQHATAAEVDGERDELLEAAGLTVLRTSAEAARTGDRFLLDELVQRLPARDVERDELALPLVYGPAQVHRLALAILEGVAAGFLHGGRWVIEIHDELDLVGELLVPYLGLIAAVDRLWGSGVAPNEVAYSVNGQWAFLRREGVAYIPVGGAEPDEPMLVVHLEPGRSATESLPEQRSVPAVVVRSAFLPVRLADSVYEGPRRAAVQIEGEEIEEALTFLLRAIFAKDGFREGQLDALFEVIEGRDCAVLLPTGAGKSLIYQLAGLCLPGRTLIVDPLVSLMEDQVEGLAQNGVDRVALLSSYETQQGRTDDTLDQIRSGEALFVFVSPERLQQRRFRTSVRELAQVSPINLAVVDEAHCVSEWGHDFRTAYLNLGRVLREVCRDSDDVPPPLLALTGTASRAVLRDVLIELGIERGSERSVVRPQTFDRPELKYTVKRVDPTEAEAALVGLLRGLPAKFGVPASDFFRAREDRTCSGLVFCPNVNGRAGIVEVADVLRPLLGAPAPIYSGSTPPRGMVKDDWERAKRRHAALFKRNQAPLLVSTKAFGMGIDKPNIRYVVHFGIPGSIEGYYQEVGRGGRDRERAECGLVLIEYDEQRARDLLDDDAELESARSGHQQIDWAESDDISRQLFFHLNSFTGVEEEARVLDEVLEELGELSRRRTVEVPMADDEDGRERALHRLVVLGVLRDYLVEWGSKKFVVEITGVDSDRIADSLLAYVGRNQPARVEAIAEEVAPARGFDEVECAEACARVLIRFVYDTVERSRRRSLREMWLAARESSRDADVEFRRRILDYLAEGDISPTLERLVDSPDFSYPDWQVELSQISGPDEARELRGNTARLLTSYPDHPGMLLARAFSELANDRGDVREFTSQLEASIRTARSRYGVSDQEIDDLLEWLVAQSDARGKAIACAAVLAVAENMTVGIDVVRPYLKAALADPAAADPGLLVLALARVLEDTLAGLNDLLGTHTEGGTP
jgi:ATP-dependent DNA helicase RecQ